MVLTLGTTKLKPFDLSLVSEPYLQWLNNPFVNQYLDLDPPKDLESLHRSCLHILEKPQCSFFAIFDSSTSTHIGNIKIDNQCSKHYTADVGLLIGSTHHQQRGHAQRAIELAIIYSKSKLALRKLCAGVLAPNIASKKLFLRVGFREEGLLINHAVLGGQRTDIHLYGYDL